MSKSIFFIFLLINFPYFCFASGVVGEWQVDVDRTVWFNSSFSTHSSLAIKLLECSAKNERLKFSSDTVAHVIDKHRCNYGGKRTSIEGFSAIYSYEIIYSSDSQSVILMSSKDRESIQVINWVSSDLFWIDEIYDDESQVIMRYFFSRYK